AEIQRELLRQTEVVLRKETPRLGILRIIRSPDDLHGGWIAKQERGKSLEAFEVITASAVLPREGVVENELARLLVALEAVVLTIDSQFAAKSQGVLARCS